MDRIQAVELASHLQDAAKAMRRASDVILALEQEDRAVLADPLGDISLALHFSS